LQLCDFLGNSANAVRWQVWTRAVALRLDALSVRDERLESTLSPGSSPVASGALGEKFNLWDLLRFSGTAGGHFRYLATPQNAYFPGFA